MTAVEQCVSGAKDHRFIGREFHKSGDELQNERSAYLSLVEGKGTHDQRNEFCWGFDIYEACEGTLVWLYGGDCVQ